MRLEGHVKNTSGNWWFSLTNDRVYSDVVMSQFKLAFGELGLDEISDYDFPAYMLIVFSTFLLTMFMMSLIVGVLTEAVGKVCDNKERNNYFTLCQIIHETEAHLLWHSASNSEKVFLVFANYCDVGKERGRTGVVLDRQNQIEENFNRRFD